jgi:DNA-binding IclR family transcriptional regulator
MKQEDIPRDVREFVARHVPTVGHMEALLLLRDAGDRGLNASDLGRRLYVPEPHAETVLRDLTSSGLVASGADGGRWCFRPGRPELADQAVRSLELYRQRLVVMTNLIHTRADTAARQFADAFRLRKGE